LALNRYIYKMAEIYLIYNNNQSITDKYIGSSNDLEKRMANHESSTRTNKKGKLYNALRSNSDCICKIIAKCPISLRYDIEQLCIDRYEPTLNSRRAKSLGTKAYYQMNKDKRIDYQKSYYQSKREHIKSKARTKFTCELCNGRYTASNKLAHFNSKKHKQFINQ